MDKMKKSLIYFRGFAILALLIAYACSSTDDTQAITIDTKTIQTHLVEISDDRYLGRKPFTKGETITVNYLREQLQQMGVEPGNGDSYFQEVPMVEIISNPSSTMTIGGNGSSTTLELREDYVGLTRRIQDEINIDDSELVFCGYGIVAPEYGKNDFDGVDLKGKTAVVLVNDPGFGQEDENYFKGNTMTYYGRWTYKYDEAARQGAEGIIIIHETASAGYPWFVVQTGWSGAQLHLESPPDKYFCALESWITLDAAKVIMAQSGQDFAQLIRDARSREFKPIPLGLKMTVSMSNTYKRDQSQNVVGLIPGSERADEYIIYSAHWDHMGVGAEVNGDSIYNGALDNASGTACLLAIAEGFTQLKKRPERSILLLFVTAEEQGLIGSAYYAENPIYPITKSVANINMDALNPFGKMKDLTIIGYGQSDMDDYAQEAAAGQERYVQGGQEPEKGYFYRSDHFNFAKVGIPALYAQGGYDHFEKGKEYAMQKQNEFTNQNYHKPSDEYNDSWDMGGLQQDAQLFFNIGLKLASETSFPEWKEGSEFKAKRDEDMRKAALKG